MSLTELLQIAQVTCPYCCQAFEVSVDKSAGDQNYVEDCWVCCSPVLLGVRVDPAGNLEEVVARREND